MNYERRLQTIDFEERLVDIFLKKIEPEKVSIGGLAQIAQDRTPEAKTSDAKNSAEPTND